MRVNVFARFTSSIERLKTSPMLWRAPFEVKHENEFERITLLICWRLAQAAVLPACKSVHGSKPSSRTTGHPLSSFSGMG
jgi:hypothetical protein